jgi:ribosomal protein S18 acetylase RimI-like enzyme
LEVCVSSDSPGGAKEPVCAILRPQEWEILRDVRLAALEDCPKAFLGSRNDEAARTPAEWRACLESESDDWYVARSSDHVISVAKFVTPPEHPNWRYVESVWVFPDYRKSGVAHRLVTMLLDKAQLAGVERVALWVFEGNEEAFSFYDRLRFTRTGRTQTLDDGRIEVEMELWICAVE